MIPPMSASLAPTDHPSHQSGPGYGSSAPPPDPAFDHGRSEWFLRRLNDVHAKHADFPGAVQPQP